MSETKNYNEDIGYISPQKFEWETNYGNKTRSYEKIPENIDSPESTKSTDSNLPENAIKIILPKKNGNNEDKMPILYLNEKNKRCYDRDRYHHKIHGIFHWKDLFRKCPKQKICENNYIENCKQKSNNILGYNNCCDYNIDKYPTEELLCKTQNEKIFYYCYRTKQKLSGLCAGFSEGTAYGFYCGLKYGGGGGWIAGGLAQFVGMFFSPFLTSLGGMLLGVMLDKRQVVEIYKDYRFANVAGGYPPVHGFFS